MAEKTAFQIDIRYDDASAGSTEIEALAEELQRRGHQVSLRRITPKGNFVQEIAKSAIVKELADGMRDVAETGMQIIKDALSVAKPKAAEPAAQNAPGFDEIGPAAAANACANSNHAVIVTHPAHILDASWDVMRIGFMPRTALESAWQPNTLDAMVIPHADFRPYLEYIHWDPKHIFEGGYLALDKNKPSQSHDEILKRFKLAPENGPVVLILASTFHESDLEALMIQLSLIKAPMQVFFYHASDNYRADMLRTLAQKYSVNARMFGRMDGMIDYLAMADIAVLQDDSEFGELLENAGVPSLCVTKSTASARLNFLAHERAAIIVPEVYKLSAFLGQPVMDAASLKSLRDAAATIASLASIPRCADAIEAALNAKGAIIPEGGRRAMSADGFETIGVTASNGMPQAFITPQTAPSQPAPQNVVMPQAAPVPQNVVAPNIQPVPPMIQPIQQPAMPGQPAQTLAPAQPGQPVIAPQPVPPMIQPIQQPIMPTIQPAMFQPTPPAPFLTPGLGSKSKEEIRSEYTKLIMIDKNLERSLDTASAEVQKWELRLDLARQNNRDDLITTAIANLQSAKTQEMALLAQKDQIKQQKALLKQSARLINSQPTLDPKNIASITDDELFGPSSEEKALEKEFMDLQKNEALQRLRDKMGRR